METASLALPKGDQKTLHMQPSIAKSAVAYHSELAYTTKTRVISASLDFL